ncbi:MAG TPA: DUF4365 domain-containing protein [Puia sp.]|uniref:DUF4365 domain-containing protein n=1 Tax=Puia sp. TaxID=2045100 RepID=UPI002CF2C3ED|nr:DUF4365 domain-containing protein [Puia sp.]HVU93729.1 DUF4365 domain-containing protein [Puia sp.]
MKRVQQHIIEEESRKAFASIIPDGWVSNDFVKDYGKDIHLEIFKDLSSTGKSFIVQLKASSQNIVNSKISVRIEVEKLKYYEQYTSPIFLVFYSTKTKVFWGTWANNLLKSMSVSLKDGQKTTQITLGERNIFDKSFFLELESKFNKSIAYKNSIFYSFDSPRTEVFTKRILGWVDKYFSGCFEIENPYLPTKIALEILDSEGFFLPKVEYCGVTFPLEGIDKSRNSNLINRPILNERDISDSEGEILFVLIGFFIGLAVDRSLKLLYYVIDKYNGPYKNTESLFEIGRIAIQNNFIYELQRLVDRAKNSKLFTEFLLLNGAYFVFDPSLRYMKEYRENLKEAISIFDKDEEKGLIAYNLANHYRHFRLFYESSENYQTCRRLIRSYLNRHYWWHEYAGVMFLAGHNKIAAAFYQKSIELDKSKENLPLTYGLRGDCCLRVGKVEEAKELYTKYLAEVSMLEKMPHLYFVFALHLCDYLLGQGLAIESFDREEAIALAKDGYAQKDMGLLRASIGKFPFDSYTWLQLGLLLEESSQFEAAYESFVASAVLADAEKSLWINVFIAAQRFEVKATGMMVYALMIQIFGNAIINEVSDLISDQPGMSEEDKINAIKFYKETAESFKSKFEPVTYLPRRDQFRIVI